MTYYALDLCEEPLRAGLAELRHNYPSITFRGLQGTYDDCLAYIGQHMPSAPGQRLVLWLGSSIGNYTRPEAAAFLRSVRDAVLATGERAPGVGSVYG